MFPRSFRHFRIAACVAALAGCASDGVVNPATSPRPSADFGPVTATGTVLISQIYGGGGNSGATYKNDYIELYNSGTTDVPLAGWSVQYSSSTGTSWQVTPLSGTIKSGSYYLIQEAAGAGGTTNLPAPDAAPGAINMSATTGKVLLANTTSALSGACATGPSVKDFVGFGAANCFLGSGPTPTLSNTTAAIRAGNGSTNNGDNSLDFETGNPYPHNAASSLPAGVAATVSIYPSTWSMKVNQFKTYSASAKNSSNASISTTYTWSSSDATIATVDQNGVVTAKKAGSASITATAASGVSATSAVVVNGSNVAVQPLSGSLPVGFQAQVYVAAGSTDGVGNPVTSSNVTWSSSNTGVVTVNANTGVLTAVSAGSATITATAKSDNTSSGSTSVTTTIAQVSPTARVGHNTDLGVPTDADPSDDIIIERRQYTISYNPNHGGPNWVSWNLDASHKGSAPRCNCFTADTALTRLGYPAYDTNDWINGGVWSRGHMSPSADWADTDGDNAPTYFLSNMLPQNQTMNAGAWGDLENYLRTLAVGNTEIYIVAGGIFTKNRSGAGVDGFGFMNSLGHIAVPDSIWKIAVVLPDTRPVNGVTTTSDIRVIAVNMPNEASASGTWNGYATTVNAIQRSTGYSLLSMLPDSIAKIVKQNDHPPATTLAAQGSTTVSVGQPVTVVGKFSDVDGKNDAPWTYVFTWGDGTNVKGATALYPTPTTQFAKSKTYDTPGTYTVRFSVSDKYGAVGFSEVVVTVQP